MRTSLLLLAALLGAPTVAHAQDTVDIGVIRNDDITVVQKMLYPKQERWELGFHLGVMPFDAYLVTPNGQISFNQHFTDTLSLSVMAGGGYGLTNATYKELESPAFGAAPYAYRYLGSVLAGVEWAPIYAKLNLNGARVVHYDIYIAGRAGVSIEQAVFGDKDIAVGPTISPGVGMRLWMGQKSALRVELRDDLQIQRRAITESTHLKQNVNLTLGVTILSPAKERR